MDVVPFEETVGGQIAAAITVGARVGHQHSETRNGKRWRNCLLTRMKLGDGYGQDEAIVPNVLTGYKGAWRRKKFPDGIVKKKIAVGEGEQPQSLGEQGERRHFCINEEIL